MMRPLRGQSRPAPERVRRAVGDTPARGGAANGTATWMGRPIAEMSRDELVAALEAAACLVRSAPLLRPDIEVRETPRGTVVGRVFNWAFLPAGHLWSDEDRTAIQARLDAFAAGHGLEGAVVEFGPDRLDVEVPRRLHLEQILALQAWLEAERDTLDVRQVP